MPVVCLDGLSFSGLAWTFRLQSSKHTETAYGTIGYLPVHFADQHMNDKG
jgi:hypothetical protein